MPDDKQLYDFIFRNTADGVLIADTQNIIRQINPAAAAMLATTVDAVMGKTPEDCFRHNAALLNLFQRGGEQILDIRLPKRRLAVGLAASLKDGARVILLQDVTEQRELESRREALIKTLAHDLRNPIGALSGFAELVGKYGSLNEQQQRFLTRIQQTTNKLHDLTETLVDLAWMEAGMPLAHVPMNLNRTIHEVVRHLSEAAHARHITIAISIQSPMPPVVGDPERLELAIYHLLHNAILYSADEQTVAIHAWGDNHEAYCSIADQGIGIADDELHLIFDRLYRSRDERVRELPGGGLGLTIARTIIKRHGGDIWASSNLGEGSTFTFVLPTVDRRTHAKS